MSASEKPDMRTVAPFFEQNKHTKLLYSPKLKKKTPPLSLVKGDRKNTSRSELEKVSRKCMSKVTLRTTCSQQELGESSEEDTAENLGWLDGWDCNWSGSGEQNGMRTHNQELCEHDNIMEYGWTRRNTKEYEGVLRNTKEYEGLRRNTKK